MEQQPSIVSPNLLRALEEFGTDIHNRIQQHHVNTLVAANRDMRQEITQLRQEVAALATVRQEVADLRGVFRQLREFLPQ